MVVLVLLHDFSLIGFVAVVADLVDDGDFVGGVGGGFSGRGDVLTLNCSFYPITFSTRRGLYSVFTIFPVSTRRTIHVRTKHQ